MSKIVLKNLTKIYDEERAVDRANIEIKDGEFLVLVGPSGCGKSTTLRMIAGLETPTTGEVWIGNENVTRLPPRERYIGMVFQSYALYPHMTVTENLSFGLRLAGEDRMVIKERVDEVADILGLTDHLDKKPSQLSGGQRQRVALGRAIIRNPSAFLFDEPLSNLDAKLRVQMRAEIQRLQKQTGITSIYVTHDQTEAMSMAHRIAIMEKGLIQQVGTPTEVYLYPRNLFVATFIGSPEMNILTGTINESGGDYIVDTEIGQFDATTDEFEIENKVGEQVYLGVRPEHLSLAEGKTKLSVEADVIEPLGSDTFLYATISNGKQFSIRHQGLLEPDYLDQVDAVDLTVREHIHLFDYETKLSLRKEKYINKQVEHS